MQKVSIILPSYTPDQEVVDYQDRFLNSLTANTAIPFEFVVVQNGSYSERLAEMAQQHVYRENPMGYARAVNLGLALATGDILIIANNDLVLPANWLEGMLADYEGGILAPQDMNVEPIIYEDAHWFSLILMDRGTFTRVGYLDELINYRFHDQDYSIRVKKAGLPVRRTGRVVVQHVNSATYKKMNRNEDPGEAEIMMQRHGAKLFSDWVKLCGSQS